MLHFQPFILHLKIQFKIEFVHATLFGALFSVFIQLNHVNSKKVLPGIYLSKLNHHTRFIHKIIIMGALHIPFSYQEHILTDCISHVGYQSNDNSFKLKYKQSHILNHFIKITSFFTATERKQLSSLSRN